MTTSSRTPEGEPNRCPVCRADVRLEPSSPPGDAPCPNCGHLLWFGEAVRPSASRSPEDEFRQFFADVFAPTPELADRVRENLREALRMATDAIRGMFGGTLTDQELLVVVRLFEGKSVADIAAETGQPERAVRRVMEKLREVTSRAPQG